MKMLFRSKNVKTSKMKNPDKTGFDLKETKLWNRSYEEGFVSPDTSGKWRAFARYKGEQYEELGLFSAEDVFTVDDWDDFRDMMYSCADICSLSYETIAILCCLYMDPRNDNRSRLGVELANDRAFFDWAEDYWSFIKWNEHGNQPSVFDFDGWDGFVGAVQYPEDYVENLRDSGNNDLAARLLAFHKKYIGKGKR